MFNQIFTKRCCFNVIAIACIKPTLLTCSNLYVPGKSTGTRQLPIL